jgi:hypothetical protein
MARIHDDQLGAALLHRVLDKVAATGWFTVGLAPMTMITSASSAAENGAGDGAGVQPLHQRRDRKKRGRSRVQWSTLLEPKPVRTSFWKDSFFVEPFAEPKPASALGPFSSRMRFRPPAARSSASSQLASRKMRPRIGRVYLVLGVLRACPAGGPAARSSDADGWM